MALQLFYWIQISRLNYFSHLRFLMNENFMLLGAPLRTSCFEAFEWFLWETMHNKQHKLMYVKSRRVEIIKSQQVQYQLISVT